MDIQDVVIETSEIVVSKFSPLEITVFDKFTSVYKNDPANIGLTPNNNDDAAALGFGNGTEPTFLTPWIIYAVKEGVAFVREILSGVIIESVSNKGKIPIARESIKSELINRLKIKTYEKLHLKGYRGREGRKIADEVIETLLFDPKAAAVLYKLIIIDSD